MYGTLYAEAQKVDGNPQGSLNSPEGRWLQANQEQEPHTACRRSGIKVQGLEEEGAAASPVEVQTYRSID
jgi:hypothetical protein